MTKEEYANRVAKILGGKVTKIERANGVFYTGIIIGS